MSPHKRLDWDFNSMMEETPSSDLVWASYVATKVSVSIDQCSIIPPSVPTKRMPSSI